MANILPDDVLCNIFACLPAKPLVRFWCVSKYWYGMLREPNFMKLRSRKTIFLPLPSTLHLIDDTSNLVVEGCYPSRTRSQQIKVIGTLNGIVVLCINEDVFMLYNPLTGVTKLLPYPPTYHYKVAYGFGYGATPDDLKIIRLRRCHEDSDIYNFRENSWSSRNISKFYLPFVFSQDVGHFINGSLYWLVHHHNVLVAVNVKDLVRSNICLPFKIRDGWLSKPLGTINGCLCALNQINGSEFDMWVMKEHDQWSKIYSLKFPLNEERYYPLRILDSRRILMVDPSKNIIIYDSLKKSYKMFNISVEDVPLYGVYALEYVESLVSPSDMCSSKLEQLS